MYNTAQYSLECLIQKLFIFIMNNRKTSWIHIRLEFLKIIFILIDTFLYLLQLICDDTSWNY